MELPANLKSALQRLGEPDAGAVSDDVFRQLIALELIEANHLEGVHFTEKGKQIFRSLRTPQPHPTKS